MVLGWESTGSIARSAEVHSQRFGRRAIPSSIAQLPSSWPTPTRSLNGAGTRSSTRRASRVGSNTRASSQFATRTGSTAASRSSPISRFRTSPTTAGARRSANTALEIIREVASGLAYAHARRIFHRDVKPENILIFENGRAALTDFGASRFAKGAERTVTEAGTLGYMAPEQAYGRGRLTSDVFSLGAIAYEILTGVLPTWPFEWPPEGHERFLAKVPEAIQPVLRKAARFDPRRRYADAGRTLYRTRARVQPGVASHACEKGASQTQSATVSARRAGQRLSPRPREGSRNALFVSTLRQSDRRRNAVLSVVRNVRQLLPRRHPLSAGLWGLRTRCASRVGCLPWCYPGRFEGNGKTPPEDSKATRTCAARDCEGQLRPFMRYCPLCKRKVKRVWSHSALPDRCPRCRWPTSCAFMRFCPWCGRREPRAGSFMPTR